MSYRVDDIEGIGPQHRASLEAIGITTVGDLIQACCSLHGRQEVSQRSGVDAERLLEWVRQADLMRIQGVGRQYAEMLRAAGIATITDLRSRHGDELESALRRVNERQKLAKTTPSSTTLTRWVDEARDLPPRIVS